MWSFIKHINRYFQTLRYLKLIQFLYRLYNLLPKTRNSLLKEGIDFNKFSEAEWFSFKKKESFDGSNFNFLNIKKEFNNNIWTQNIDDHLWNYNLHYLDFLNDIDTFNKKDIVLSWMRHTTYARGTAYEPYPTSLRLVNLIKWNISKKEQDSEINKNIFLQSRWLYKNLEWHLLANHLFSNLKALAFSGYLYNNKESKNWLSFAKINIKKQLQKQILDDGGHYEKSPMYHNIILHDLLDLYHINRISKCNYDSNFEFLLVKFIKKMLHWSLVLSHEDKCIAFFNDSSFGVGPESHELQKYALSFMEPIVHSQEEVNFFKESGYIKVKKMIWSAILDVGDIGLNFNPGHAHADSLSFELSVNSDRLFVNSGTSVYGNSSLRLFQRSTAAHNTVEVNSKNSSDVWNAFRVASRAKNLGTEILKEQNSLTISSSHDGYNNFFSKNIHKREWVFFNKKIILNDEISGKNTLSISRLYLHPKVVIKEISHEGIKVKLPSNNVVYIEIIDSEFSIKDSEYFNEFGRSLKNKCIQIKLKKNQSSISVSML